MSWQVLLLLLVAIVLSLAASRVAVQLRTPADRQVQSPVLDSGILMGLCAPVAVLGHLLQDRAAWLLATGARRAWPIRLAWCGSVTAIGGVVAAVLALTARGQASRLLVFADLLLLLALAMIGAILLGGAVAWILPLIVALVASTPGLVPLGANWLVRADRSVEMLWSSLLLLVMAWVGFTFLDDYELSRTKRLVERTPGVVDD